MPRNIVVFCDGTGNEIEENLSNVLKLYQLAKRDDEQITFYDSGVGTIGRLNNWSKFRDKVREVATGATGYGLDQNVIDAYSFLARNYMEGDRIYLFGFSRGAYTVRVLAGFIRAMGLLQQDQLNLVNYALKWYKSVADGGDFRNIWRFSEITKARDVTIHFLGVWDTVSSLFRPNGKLLSLGITNRRYPYTVNNDAIRFVRHAVAIDEKRKAFKADLWGEERDFKSHKFDKTPEVQDVKEVWFAGVHSDIGGGYPESESGLAKLALKWMAEEAVDAGLAISRRRFERLVNGAASGRSKRAYVRPDSEGVQHNSYGFFWRLMGPHVRKIPEGSLVHQSVRDRLDSEKVQYAPTNLTAVDVTWVVDHGD